MQYFGKALGSVSKTWSSINPSTLSGAVDVIVVKHDDGSLHCSPFHVRFGKFQLLRPSKKKVRLAVNGQETDIPMKLGDGGEAFFVFKTDDDVPAYLQTSPVVSPINSPREDGTPEIKEDNKEFNMEELDIGEARDEPLRDRLNIPDTIDLKNEEGLLDMDGYKPDERDVRDSEVFVKHILQDEFGTDVDVNEVMKQLPLGSSPPPPDSPVSIASSHSASELSDDLKTDFVSDVEKKETNEKYFVTLRLTSAQLNALPLNPGKNILEYTVDKATITAHLYLWNSEVPIVISDIDGTITKSDALGHVLTMIGRDWTHEGVAKLFTDIHDNGYNVMYLTARSVGLADTTRAYLAGIDQNGTKLPYGPVILSPDRTFQALRREIVYKKPEVFKMACLGDIRKLYFSGVINEDQESDGGSWDGTALVRAVSQASDEWSDVNTNTVIGTTESQIENSEGQPYFVKSIDGEKHHLLNPEINIPNEDLTPFYAGFGNRITDAISYRSVGIPSSRIFTINPEGDVRMELLEMAGYKGSYVSIGELVDQFFPVVRSTNILPNKDGSEPKSPNWVNEVDKDEDVSTLPRILGSNVKNKFTDVNYWNQGVDLSLISDSESETGSTMDVSSGLKLQVDHAEHVPQVTDSTLSPETPIKREQLETTENGFGIGKIISPRLGFWRTPGPQPTTATSDVNATFTGVRELAKELENATFGDEDVDEDYSDSGSGSDFIYEAEGDEEEEEEEEEENEENEEKEHEEKDKYSQNFDVSHVDVQVPSRHEG